MTERSRPDIEGFLTHLALERRVAAATQNQALSALLFLYEAVLEIELPWLQEVVRAKRCLLYGAGLRLSEALRLRVKDIDFEYRQIVVRDGKGRKDRVSVLPDTLLPHLQAHLAKLREWLGVDADRCTAPVSMPYAIKRKYPHASRSWPWQYVFPSAGTCRDPLDVPAPEIPEGAARLPTVPHPGRILPRSKAAPPALRGDVSWQ